MERDKKQYDSVSVKLTTLKSGNYRATIIVVSKDGKGIGEYCLDQQQYISKVVAVDSTKKLGLGGVQGIVRSPSEIMKENETNKKIKQGIEDELEFNKKNAFAPSSPLQSIINSPPKKKKKKAPSFTPQSLSKNMLQFDEQNSILNPQQQYNFPSIGDDNYNPKVLNNITVRITGKFPWLKGVVSKGGGYKDLDLGKNEMAALIISYGGAVTTALSSADYVLIGIEPGFDKLAQRTKRSSTKRVPIINVDSLHRLVTGAVSDEILRKEPDAKFGPLSRASTFGYKKKKKATKRKSSSTCQSNKRKKKNAKFELNSDDEESDDERKWDSDAESEDEMDMGGQVDEWVECTTCGKWRKLPASISADSLPDEWYCTENTWDARFATCSAVEESWE